MTELLEIIQNLNNREQVFITYTVIILLGLFSIRNFSIVFTVTGSELIKKFLKPLLISTGFIIVFLCYMGLLPYFMIELGLWESAYLKILILWSIYVGVVLLFKFIDNQFPHELFKTTLYASIGFTAVLEFIIDAYVFSFWVEFFLVGFMSTIVFLIEASRVVDNGEKLNSLLEKIIFYAVLTILAGALFNIFNNLDDFLTLDTLKALLFPILLTLYAIPFYYFFLLLVRYYDLFFILNRTSRADSLIRRKVKFTVFKYCLLNLSKITKISNMGKYHLYSVETEKDLKALNKYYNKIL